MTYNEAKAVLKTRTSRKIGNNTYLKLRDGGAIAVMLHWTDVVTFYPDGSIKLSTGGWFTRTTFDRIGKYAPVRIWSRKGTKTLHRWNERKEVMEPVAEFVDGMVISETGKVLKDKAA